MGIACVGFIAITPQQVVILTVEHISSAYSTGEFSGIPFSTYIYFIS